MINLQQNTPEWLEFRKGKIGASDSPIILGVSPWKTAYELWEEKLGLTTPQETFIMKRGHLLEEEARERFIYEKGIHVSPSVRAHKENEWMIASLDGISSDGKTAVEIKCPGKKTHHMAMCGEIPHYYITQMQHQMYVCDLEQIFYYSYDGCNGVCLTIERDEKAIKKIVDCDWEFYECLRTFKMPELSYRDKTQVSGYQWRQISDNLKEIKKQQAILNSHLDDLSKQEEEIKEKLISICGDKNCYGNGVSLTKVHRKGSVDYSKIYQIQDIDLEPYRKKTTTYWRVAIDN